MPINSFLICILQILLYGGYSKVVSSDTNSSEKGIVHSDMWSLDPRTWEWSKVCCNPYFIFKWFNQHLYRWSCGRTYNSLTVDTDICHYGYSEINSQFFLKQVKKGGMPPGPRAGFSMCLHKKRAVLFGGVVDKEVEGSSTLTSLQRCSTCTLMLVFWLVLKSTH